MLDTYIIDGKRTEIIVLCKIFNAELLEVTSFSDRCRNYIHSGFQFLKLQGKSINGEEVDRTFQVIDKKDGIFYLKTMVNDCDLKFKV